MIARAACWLAVACGVAGLLVSLAAMAGVWVVRSQVDAQVVALTDDVDRLLGRAELSLSQVKTRLDVVRGRVRQLGDRGERLAQSGTAGQEAIDRLMQSVDRELGDEYRQFREAWSALYARVETIMDGVERLQQVLPQLQGVSLPRDELEAFDQHARQIDDALRGLGGRLSSAAAPVESALESLVDSLNRIDDGLGSLAVSVLAYETRFQGMRAATLAARSTAQDWLMLGAIMLTLVFVYGVLAHAALIVLGWRHLQRLEQADTAENHEPGIQIT